MATMRRASGMIRSISSCSTVMPSYERCSEVLRMPRLAERQKASTRANGCSNEPDLFGVTVRVALVIQDVARTARVSGANVQGSDGYLPKTAGDIEDVGGLAEA